MTDETYKDAVERLSEIIGSALAAQDLARAEQHRWESDPRLTQLCDMGLVVTAALIWPVQSSFDARRPDAVIMDTVLRCGILGGPDAVLAHFEAMDDLGESLAEDGCPMELLFAAHGPWSPRDFGFVRSGVS
tara:strand:- start:3126 stop:3521 length:396 start_codon:yes stop_codon:yes gene_type:complete